MMREHGTLIVWPSLLAAGLLAAACTDQPNVNMAPKRPSFWFTPPPAQCVTGKWTGGGRIDPTGNRAASNYDNVDELAGDQNCIVKKGEIEVNGHALKIAWHVSIHDGVDAYDGRPVFANEFSDGHPGGVCVVVGVPDNFMTAREKGPGATEPSELTQFEVCDNDRGGRQNTRSDAMRWRSEHHGDTGLTYLKGGNVVEHGS